MTNPLEKDTDGDGFSDGLEVSKLTDPTKFTSTPGNFALTGRGIIGTNDAIDDDEGTFYEHVGVAGNVNDGLPATRVDTWDSGGGNTASFVGVEWDAPIPQAVSALSLTMATFFDGGWFGPNGDGPGTGGTLDPAYLTEPAVQITKDGGTTWTTVPHTSDYLAAFDGAALPVVDCGPPTTYTAVFTLDSPETGLTGIRIIGDEGRTASGGFIGVWELAVEKGAPGTPFAVTDFSLDPSNDATPLTITWNSRPGKQYTLFWGTDLVTFAGEVADGILSGGVTTTYSFPNPAPELNEMYFRVDEE